jgi:hemerythrin-like metal-binding protein
MARERGARLVATQAACATDDRRHEATMALMTWSDSMSVGIARIDKEHQGLIALINQLNNEVAAGKTKEVLDGVFTKLIDYTKSHFSYEESLLRSHSYPNLPTQNKEHVGFTQKVIEMQTNFKSGKSVLGSPILTFLSNWLVNHILKEDMAYKPFLATKGLK